MPRLSNLEKVIALFKPDKNGYSRKVNVEEIENSNLTWNKNGNGRRGKFLVFKNSIIYLTGRAMKLYH